MTARLFYRFAADICPLELEAMCVAHQHYRSLMMRYREYAPDVTEADCIEARRLFRQAETQARAAFRSRYPSQQAPA